MKKLFSYFLIIFFVLLSDASPCIQELDELYRISKALEFIKTDFEKLTPNQIADLLAEQLKIEKFDVSVIVTDSESDFKSGKEIERPIWNFFITMKEKYQGEELEYLVGLSAGLVALITSKTSWKSNKLELMYSRKIPRTPRYDKLQIEITTTECRGTLKREMDPIERGKYLLKRAKITR